MANIMNQENLEFGMKNQFNKIIKKLFSQFAKVFFLLTNSRIIILNKHLDAIALEFSEDLEN